MIPYQNLILINSMYNKKIRNKRIMFDLCNHKKPKQCLTILKISMMNKNFKKRRRKKPTNFQILLCVILSSCPK